MPHDQNLIVGRGLPVDAARALMREPGPFTAANVAGRIG
jgi:hypothetical protein